MKYWLMKSEPDVFSWQDLEKMPEQVGHWDGVRNYQARNYMRDEFRLGDQILFYHSSCAEPGIAGIAEVVREAYPDVTALDPKSEYFDEKSAKAEESRWVMVDVRPVRRFQKTVTLKELRDTPELSNMLLLRPGQRLSVQPVTSSEWNAITSRWQ